MKIFLITVFLFAFFLRFFALPQNLFFASEQGRDLLILKDMVQNHKFTLIGPRTSVEGIFHGPLYYYFSLIPYVLGKGNPMVIMVFYILWQALGVIFFFLLVKEFLGKEESVWASLLYASSYGLIVYSRWLSHPGLIIPMSVILFWLLLKISQGKNIFYSFTILVWSTIFHFDLVVAIFLIPVIIIFLIWQKQELRAMCHPERSEGSSERSKRAWLDSSLAYRRVQNDMGVVVLSVLVFLLSFSSYILFDLRHNFLMLKSFKNFLLKSQGFTPGWINAFSHLVFRYGQEVKDILGPNLNFVFLFFIIPLLLLFFKHQKNSLDKLLVLWLLFVPTLGIFINPLFGLKHYLVGLGPFIILLPIWCLSQFKMDYQKWLVRVVLLFLFLNNLFLINQWLPKNYDMFYLDGHPSMVLSNEIDVIDYVYKDSGSKNFGWEAFTIPYWSESGWKYLFWWYGKNKYGFLPKRLKKGDIFYVIIEPGSDKLFLDNWLKEKMDPRGKMVEERNFEGIRVQKRDTLL